MAMDNAVKDELAVDECWIVEKEKLVEVVKSLGYDVLIDVVGVDYL
jgi:hypothetical protein